jgi:predicted ester cyclase
MSSDFDILIPAGDDGATLPRPDGVDVTALASRPADEAIASPGRDISAFFADDGVRRQLLDGFEDRYADIVHYIIRCTHRIWEEAGIGLIYSHYTHDCEIHTSDGPISGRDRIVAMTARALAAYPDIRLVGNDVVWSGDAQRGFHTSHRMVHLGTDLGWSAYGPPTSKRIRRRAVAHCVVLDNRIVEEWLARDELSVVRTLGLDEFEVARRIGAAEARARGGPVVGLVGELRRQSGQSEPVSPQEPPEGMSDVEWSVVGGLQRVWNERRLDLLDGFLAPDVVVETSTDLRFNGLAAYRAWMLRWLGAYSDLTVTFEHTMSNERLGGTVIASRWRLEGTHDGPGPHGEPTGRRMRAMAFTHHLVQNGRVTGEWTVIDEFAVLKQLHTPDEALQPPVADRQPEGRT